MSRTKTAYNYKMRKTYCCNISVGETERMCTDSFLQMIINYRFKIKMMIREFQWTLDDKKWKTTNQ